MTIADRLDQFAKKIRPTDEHIKEANRQTDFMIERLTNRVASDGRFTLEKVLKAGSNAKFTSLRKTEENIFDVDLGAYFSGEGATKDQLGRLLQFTCDQLRGIYPNKAREDFEVLKSAVRVKFRSGIELWVDVAPIIRDDSLGFNNGGWIPRDDGEWRLTSVTCHIDFIHKRTKRSNKIDGPVKFNRLVRTIKWWNNLQEDLAQPSYFCDLITAAACEDKGVTKSWDTSLLQVFSFLRRHQLQEPIVFADYYDPQKITLPQDPVIILDVVNAENNITRLWTDRIRQDFLDRVQDAYDAISQARACDQDGDEKGAIEEWSRVFGDKFEALSEPDD